MEGGLFILQKLAIILTSCCFLGLSSTSSNVIERIDSRLESLGGYSVVDGYKILNENVAILSKNISDVSETKSDPEQEDKDDDLLDRKNHALLSAAKDKLLEILIESGKVQIDFDENSASD